MREALRPGDLSVDAGAYKGGYTYWMRHAVGEAGRVVAFEPQPELARFLGRLVAAFGWTNVEVEPSGLTSRPRTATLYVPGAKPSQRASLEWEREGARPVEVRLVSLDGWLETYLPDQRVAFLKCDVEGHELDAFRGAARVLESHRPRLLFECEARHAPGRAMEDVFAHLAELGYQGSFFWEGDLVPLAEFDLEVHQVPGRRPYANNFAFVPVG
jgi:FkbM family methyltransferase